MQGLLLPYCLLLLLAVPPTIYLLLAARLVGEREERGQRREQVTQHLLFTHCITPLLPLTLYPHPSPLMLLAARLVGEREERGQWSLLLGTSVWVVVRPMLEEGLEEGLERPLTMVWRVLGLHADLGWEVGCLEGKV